MASSGEELRGYLKNRLPSFGHSGFFVVLALDDDRLRGLSP
jgi:hypothetical protein